MTFDGESTLDLPRCASCNMVANKRSREGYRCPRCGKEF